MVQFSPPAALPFAGPEQAFLARLDNQVKFANTMHIKRLQKGRCAGKPEL